MGAAMAGLIYLMIFGGLGVIALLCKIPAWIERKRISRAEDRFFRRKYSYWGC